MRLVSRAGIGPTTRRSRGSTQSLRKTDPHCRTTLLLSSQKYTYANPVHR
jgi:hypothetical protein